MDRSLVAKLNGVVLAAVGTAALVSGRPAWGQALGPGASPGRASYRTPAQWNDGPYYTAPHWNPYAPRRAVDTGLIYNEPLAPPFNNQPRGLVTSFYPSQGTLYPFRQGFSPFSDYAPWYERSYNLVPTRADRSSASTAYFRSSPIPPIPEILDPRVATAIVAAALPAGPVTTDVVPATLGAAGPKVLQPGAAGPVAAREGTVVYRGGLPPTGRTPASPPLLSRARPD